jgi:hypothetical protein
VRSPGKLASSSARDRIVFDGYAARPADFSRKIDVKEEANV